MKGKQALLREITRSLEALELVSRTTIRIGELKNQLEWELNQLDDFVVGLSSPRDVKSKIKIVEGYLNKFVTTRTAFDDLHILNRILKGEE